MADTAAPLSQSQAAPDDTKNETKDETKAEPVSGGAGGASNGASNLHTQEAFANARLRELTWDQKDLNRHKTEDKNYLQDTFMWKFFKYIRFMRNKYKEDKIIKNFLGLIKSAMVVTKKMQDGTDPNLVSLLTKKKHKALEEAGKTIALPPKKNPFAKVMITKTENETMKRKMINMFIKMWWDRVNQYYASFMMHDDNVWNVMNADAIAAAKKGKEEGTGGGEEGDASGSSVTSSSFDISSIFEKLKMKERWPTFKREIKDKTFNLVHTCTILSRIYLGIPRPDNDNMERIMQNMFRAATGNMSTEEMESDHKNIFKSLFGESNQNASQMFDSMMKKVGGFNNMKKMLRGDVEGRRSIPREEFEAKFDEVKKSVMDILYDDKPVNKKKGGGKRKKKPSGKK